MFNTILVAYDGSDHARQALKTAAALAKVHGSELHLSHTPEIDTPPVVVGSFVSVLEKPPTDAQVAEAGEHIVTEAKAMAEKAGVPLKECHVGRGSPSEHTLQDAEAINADLIVMGRRGLGAVRSLAMGSVSQAVASGSNCACMTVV